MKQSDALTPPTNIATYIGHFNVVQPCLNNYISSFFDMTAMGAEEGLPGKDQGNGPLFAQIEFRIVQSKTLSDTDAQKVGDSW